MAFTVRRSQAGDLLAIQEIYAHHVRHGLGSFEEVPPNTAEMGRRRQDLIAHGFPYLTALAHGRVAGYAYASPYLARSAYRFSVQDSIYIAPDWLRQGVGRALLGRLIDDCTALGYRQMIAINGDSANEGSIQLHRALGFAPTGTLKAVGFKLGRWVDSVLMQRALGPGAATLPDKTGV
jgi:phosphinothricin acetyltransferase